MGGLHRYRRRHRGWWWLGLSALTLLFALDVVIWTMPPALWWPTWLFGPR
jgi:hypothetical protein